MKIICPRVLLLSVLVLSLSGCSTGPSYEEASRAHDKELAEQTRLEQELAALQDEMKSDVEDVRQRTGQQLAAVDQLSGTLNDSLAESLKAGVDADDQAAAESKAQDLRKQLDSDVESMVKSRQKEIERSYKPEISRLTKEIEKQKVRVERAAKRMEAAQSK